MATEVTPRPGEGAANPLRAGLDSNRISDPCTIVFFGASGDLTKRMLMPAMYNLRLGDVLPTSFGIVGFSRSEKSHYDFREEMKEAIDQFSRTRGRQKIRSGATLPSACTTSKGRSTTPIRFRELKRQLDENDEKLGTEGNRLYYLATPPSVFAKVVQQLAAVGLGPKDQAKGWSRVIVEKPFGTDLDSARALQTEVIKVFDEKQVYRIDHYPRKRARPRHHERCASRT